MVWPTAPYHLARFGAFMLKADSLHHFGWGRAEEGCKASTSLMKEHDACTLRALASRAYRAAAEDQQYLKDADFSV